MKQELALLQVANTITNFANGYGDIIGTVCTPDEPVPDDLELVDIAPRSLYVRVAANGMGEQECLLMDLDNKVLFKLTSSKVSIAQKANVDVYGNDGIKDTLVFFRAIHPMEELVVDIY